MPDDLPAPAPDASLYPAGHLERLTYQALIAERDAQRDREEAALAAWEMDAATSAAARARLCTAEIIRRRLAALCPTEPAPCKD